MKVGLRIAYCTSLVMVLISGYFPASAMTNGSSLVLEQVDVTAYPQVTLQFSAWSSDGAALPAFQPQDITLQEDGGAPFHPQAVAVNNQAALSVVLVIDISGSMAGQPLVDAKVAAARFLDRLTPGDRAALLAFSDGVEADPEKLNPQRELGFSTNLQPAYDMVESLKAGGATHLYNILTKAVRLTAEQPPGHRAVLLLSDGRNDPPNLGDPDAPIQKAKKANVPILVIGLGNQVDEPYLRRLAAETGGVFRAAPRSSELAQVFTDSAALLKTQYQLTYISKLPGDGQVHTLKMSLAGGPTSQISFGPLPVILQAAASATSIPPTPAPTLTPVPPSPTPLPVSPPPSTDPAAAGDPLRPWIIALVGLIVAAGALALVLSRRGPRAAGERCGNCGDDRSGRPGPSPNCGSTRRLPAK